MSGGSRGVEVEGIDFLGADVVHEEDVSAWCEQEHQSGSWPFLQRLVHPRIRKKGSVANGEKGGYSCGMATAEAVAKTAGAVVDEREKIFSRRLMCLDIYRGLMVAGMILVDNPGSDEGAYWPIIHAKWNGWTPADFIFPSFLFLVGISMVLHAVTIATLLEVLARLP